MNKHSSNLMAQQLLLSLARAAGVAPVNNDTAAAWLQTWFDAHGGRAGGVASRLVNGSGLARETRVTAANWPRCCAGAGSSLDARGWPRCRWRGWMARSPASRRVTGPPWGAPISRPAPCATRPPWAASCTRDGRRLIVVALVNHPRPVPHGRTGRPAALAGPGRRAPAATAAAAGPSDPPTSAPARHSPTLICGLACAPTLAA